MALPRRYFIFTTIGQRMSTYEILDAIADSYNPLLFIGYIVFSVIYWRRGDKVACIRGFVGIVIAYSLMFLDSALGLWKSLGLDYSTHTAVALALIVFHIHKRPLSSGPAISFMVSLLAYYALMVYQEYHSFLDIVSTALAIAPFITAAYWALLSRSR